MEAYLDISYLRVSTLWQRIEGTIETQRYALDRHFEQTGVRVPDELRFEDDGVSGGIEIAERPDGRKVCDLIATGRVRRLFLFHSDRIGRDTIDTLLFHRLAAANGTRIIGIADGTDTAREGSALETELRAVIAAEYRRDCSRKTRAGIRRRVCGDPARGIPPRVTCHAPFGFRVENGSLIPVAERADVMKRNFEDYARGLGARQVCAKREAEGAPSPRGKGWRPDTLIYLLKHRAYVGEFSQLRTPIKIGKGRWMKRDPSERVIIPCPAIVSRPLFDAVQAQIIANYKGGRMPQKQRNYMLRGLVRCGRCRHAYVGHTVTGRRYKDKVYPPFVYYECGTLSNPNYDYCGNPRVNAVKLETKIWQTIEEFARKPSRIINQVAARYNRQTQTEARESTRRLAATERERAQNREARERLALAVARGVLSDSDALLARDTLEKESARIESEATRRAAARAEETINRRALAEAKELLDKLRARIEQGISPQLRAEVMRLLVKRAEIHPGSTKRPRVVVDYVFIDPACLGTEASPFRLSSLKK
jgi:site-specific DNA recombinase